MCSDEKFIGEGLTEDDFELIDYIEELVRNFDNSALEVIVEEKEEEEDYDDDDLIDDVNLLQSHPKFANSLFTSFKYFIQTVKTPLQYKMFCFVTVNNKKPKIPKHVHFNGRLFEIHYEFTIEKHNCDELKMIAAVFHFKFLVPHENANKIVCKINIFKTYLQY